MAFRERIVPNLRGVPREVEPVEHERRDPSPDLTPEEKARALKFAREHRISMAAAIEQLFDEGGTP